MESIKCANRGGNYSSDCLHVTYQTDCATLFHWMISGIRWGKWVIRYLELYHSVYHQPSFLDPQKPDNEQALNNSRLVLAPCEMRITVTASYRWQFLRESVRHVSALLDCSIRQSRLFYRTTKKMKENLY